MTLKYQEPSDAEQRFESAIRAHRLRMPDRATLAASKLQETLGRVSGLVAELQRQGSRGCDETEQELVLADGDAYEMLVTLEGLLYRNKKSRNGETL